MRKKLLFLLAVIVGALRGRPVEIPHVRRGAPGAFLTPDGRLMPAMVGGDETPEEKAAREEAERKAAEDEAEAAEAEARKAEEEREAAEEDEGKWDGEVDKKRAERAVANARAAEKRAKERAEEAERERDELRQAQETEHETTKRERDEAKLEAERAKATAERMIIDGALRDAAADADVPPKKVRRLLKLVDRDEITVDDEGEVAGAAEAIADVLDEFPEFGPKPAGGDDDNPPKEEPGGKPDRKRQPKELTAEQVTKMAREDPEQFNQLFDEGKIPASALSKS